MSTWLESPGHRRWLGRHTAELLAFGAATARPGGGAWWLRADGRPDVTRPVLTWITARMLHVYGLGVLLGAPGASAVAEVALAGLTGGLRDEVHGGWHHDLGGRGDKSCYDHAFVLLAATTAAHAGLRGASELVDDAGAVLLHRFWDDDAGRCLDAWDGTFAVPSAYRGINANMHAVEAMLAAADWTGDPAWRERAGRVARFVVAAAEPLGWRIPEHFDEHWEPDLERYRDRPDDPFRPYGATVGHGLEWSRLLLHLEAAGIAVEPGAAAALFARAVADGWSVEGASGFVYTTDWDGRPVVCDRMHWVLAEAIAGAAALWKRTGDPTYAAWYRRWWDGAATWFIDPRLGSWHHQLDATNRVIDTVWPGKPDLYHALQATLLPRVPLAPSLAAAVAAGLVH